MLTKFKGIFTFSTQLTTPRNSINPVGQFIAYGYYFPKEWTQQRIYSELDPSKKKISFLQVVKNRLSQPTGKVLFKFNTKQVMQHYLDKYNEDFIMTKEEAHRVIIKPFELKTESKKEEKEARKTKNAVKVKNLDFDISKEELQRLGKDFGKVEFVEMQVRANGLNNGLATVYFAKAKEAQDFSYFIHNLVFRERKLSAEVMNMRKQDSTEIQYLVEPSITLNANERLYKRMVVEQANIKERKQE